MSPQAHTDREGERRRFVADPDTLGAVGVTLEQLSDPDVRSVVIGHDHPEFERALKEGRREVEGNDGPLNPRLHLAMHQIVATQLWDDSPPEVWDTAVRLWTQATSDTRSCTCSVVRSASRSGKRCTTSVLTIASVTSPRYARFPALGSASARL